VSSLIAPTQDLSDSRRPESEGFTPGAAMRLVWETSRQPVSSEGFTPKEHEIGDIKADAEGRIARRW